MARKGTFDGKGKMLAILKEHPLIRMTARDIAENIIATFPADCEEKKNRSEVLETPEDLIAQISAEIGSFWRSFVDNNPEVQFIETRPRQFYYDSDSNGDSEEQIPDNVSLKSPNKVVPTFSEHDLYPILGTVVFNEMRCYSMRIDERSGSNNRGPKGNHWLYPDIVGMIPLSDHWVSEVSVLANSLATERVHLVSFEVKKDIKRSDVREKFFQTVSNSSWANYSYLVAAELKGGDANDELTLLCSSYGIGFIQLDLTEPANSQVKIPARLKESIDVNGLNRLATDNPDAREFVENVSTYIKTSRLKRKDWDLVPEDE